MNADDLRNRLIIPIYLNEKTVLDMLATVEDGFSMVSEVRSSNQNSSSVEGKISGGLSSNDLISKLLRIKVEAKAGMQKGNNLKSETKSERVHTSVSLLSKFRSQLIANRLISSTSNQSMDFTKLRTGDFVEVEGELRKNPIIELVEKFRDGLRMEEILTASQHQSNQRKSNKSTRILSPQERQINLFLEEIKNTGTVDFILENESATLVLSTQTQYLTNDNISEIIGGRFRVLGKVIKICRKNSEGINLLRKTSLSLLKDSHLKQLEESIMTEELKQLNLPEFKYKIPGPSAIIIPIAIFA